MRSQNEHFDRENRNMSFALNYDLMTVTMIFEPTCRDTPNYSRPVYPEDLIQGETSVVDGITLRISGFGSQANHKEYRGPCILPCSLMVRGW